MCFRFQRLRLWLRFGPFCAYTCVSVSKTALVCIYIHVFCYHFPFPHFPFSFSFSFSISLSFRRSYLCAFNCRDSNPVLILKPAELAGMSLENRLTSYDWQSQFDVFQRVTRNGSFRPICLDAKNNMLAVSIQNTRRIFVIKLHRQRQRSE